jgi:hypothetical protein
MRNGSGSGSEGRSRSEVGWEQEAWLTEAPPIEDYYSGRVWINTGSRRRKRGV